MPVVVVESSNPPSSGAPLIPPNSHYSGFEFKRRKIIGMSASPFTGSQQTYEWPAAFWSLSATLPPMARADAAEWQAFLIECDRSRTFVAGDPLAQTPRGSVAGVSGVTIPPAQVLNSKTIDTWGWTAAQTNILRKMDYFQIPRNYLQNPSAIDQAGWDSEDTPPTLTADFLTAPDGTATADRIVFPGSASRWMQDFFNAPGAVEEQTFIFTVWLKSTGSITARISLRDAVVDASPIDEEVTDQSVAITSSWQRFSVTRKMRAGIDSAMAEISNLNDNASKTVYAWGACVYSMTQDARLYAVLNDANSDSSTESTLRIFPPLRSAGADIEACPIITDSPVGEFRILDDEFGWFEDVNKHWRDMSFQAIQNI